MKKLRFFFFTVYVKWTKDSDIKCKSLKGREHTNVLQNTFSGGEAFLHMDLQAENKDNSSRFDYDHLFKKVLCYQMPQTNEKA